MTSTDALRACLTLFSSHPLLERLFFASVEFAVLAVLVFGVIRVGRIRSPRLAALLWLLVLGKPLVSLAVGSPFHLFRMEVPAAVVEAPAPLEVAAHSDPQVPAAAPTSFEVQSPLPVGMDEEMAGAPLASPSQEPTQTPTTSPIISVTAVPAPLAPPSPLRSPVAWILGIWLTGVAFFAANSLVDRARIRQLVRTARKPEPRLSDRYSALAANMGLKRPAPLRVTDEIDGPALVGSVFSTILIPGWLAEDANEAKLDWALRHELMHFRLRDPWAGLVPELSQMLFFFHPVAWWAGAKWKTATEKACDRAIVADEAAARDYAEQLYRILVGIHGRRQAALRTGLFATRTQIGQRIAALLYGPRTAPHLNALALVVVALVAAVTLSVGGAFADKNSKTDNADKASEVAAADQTPAQVQATAESSATPRPTESAKQKTADETFTYAGTVVDEDGKPVPGAHVSIAYWSANQSAADLPALAVSDAQGRFQFSRRGSDFSDAITPDAWASAAIFATSEGRGFAAALCIDFETTPSRADLKRQWQMEKLKYLGAGQGNVLRLVRDDVPIRGRILDTEERPVAGALVETMSVWEPADGSLSAWETAAKQHRHLEDKSPGGLRPLVMAYEITGPRTSVVPPVCTDATGSFTLKGLGRERIADLVVSAAGVESTIVRVRSRAGDLIKLPRETQARQPAEDLFYPCSFLRVVGPSVPIEGRVIDAKSGRPLADVTVRSDSIASVFRPADATTDHDGHYRLLGLPPGKQHLIAVPPTGSRYFAGGVDFVTQINRKPAIADIRLDAGVLLEGRVTEVRNGKPISGYLEFFAFRANPHLPELSRFLSRYVLGSEFQLVDDVQGKIRYIRNRRGRADRNGAFSVPVLPGKGILAFRASNPRHFPEGVGADRIGGEQDGASSGRSFDTAPIRCDSQNYHLLTPINLEAGTEHWTLDLTLASALTLKGRVRAPDGRVLSDYSLFAQQWPSDRDASWFRNTGETFEVDVYPPQARRLLMFYQPASDLVGLYESTGEPSGPLEITLQPGATLKGRVVDEGGRPLGGLSLVVASSQTVGRDSRSVAATVRQVDESQITTDKEGRFELRGVVPGLAYSARVWGSIASRAGHSLPGGTVFSNILARAGETRELGDLRIVAAVKASAEPAKAKDDRTRMNVARRRAEPVAFADGRQPGPETAATSDVAFTYAGTVLDDHGKPVAGARLALDYWHLTYPAGGLPVLAVSDSQGRFQFSRRKSDFSDAGSTGPWWFAAMIVATKEGYGLAGAPSIQFETTGKLVEEQHQPPGPRPKAWSDVLKLAADDVPIQGRILDTEGRPVSGARVQAINAWAGRDGTLESWERAAQEPKAVDWRLLAKLRALNLSFAPFGTRPPLVPAVRTDATGGFLLKGVGRERIVDLAVSGPGIETMLLHVRTRRGTVIKVPSPYQIRVPRFDSYYPCEFTHVAGPSIPVEGHVIDAKSKRPLARIMVRADRIGADPLTGGLPARQISTTTDADGGYRLQGLPLGLNRLGIVPPIGSRYLHAGLDVTTRRGDTRFVADIPLTAGILVRGRVTDSRTGMRVPGSVEYFAFLTNPHLDEAQGFEKSETFGAVFECRTNENGLFEIPVLPGKGILAFRADSFGPFPLGVGADRIDGAKEQTPSFTSFATAPSYCRVRQYHLLTPLDPQPGTSVMTLGLTLRSGVTVKGKVLAADGKPLSDYYIFGATWIMSWSRNQGETFEVEGYDPTEHRRLMFYHPGRNLVGLYDLSGEPPAELEIKLHPGATIAGRVVDAGGRPLENMSIADSPLQTISPDTISPDNRAEERQRGVLLSKYLQEQIPGQRFATDKQGRFKLRGIIPGLRYSGTIFYTGGPWGGYPVSMFTDVIAKEGETKDLGDLPFKPPGPHAAVEPPKAKTENADATVIRGRVLLPDGRPAAGARVFALRRFQTAVVHGGPLAKTTAGPHGEFTIPIPRNQPSYEMRGGGPPPIAVAAEAQSCGTQWRLWRPQLDGSKVEVVLKLVPESLLHGRIVDREGKPVRGVRVKRAWQIAIDDDFEPWLAAVKSGDTPFPGPLADQLSAYDDESEAPVVTDQDGRFTLTGIGADRLAGLDLRGDTIAYAALNVVAHPIKPVTIKNRAGEAKRLFGADFTYEAAPTRPIVGTVRDAASGAPLAGVSIESKHFAGTTRADEGAVRTVSDPQGRYRLVGMPQANGRGPNDINAIAVVPNDDQPYFGLNWVEVRETPELVATTLDLKLTRGLWITGRVTDKATGKPVPAWLIYSPFRSNPFAASFPELQHNRANVRDMMRKMPRPDGSYRLVGLPGRGLVTAYAQRGTFRVDAAAAKIAGMTYDGRFSPFGPGSDVAQQIDPAPGTESVTCDLVFDPGGTVRVSLVDGAGKPAGPCVIQFSPAQYHTVQSRSLDSTFDMNGLAPNEPRPLLIEQPRRQIGKALLFHYDEQAPRTMTVTLEPCATIKGRLLGEDGVPLKHLRLSVTANLGAGHSVLAPPGQSNSEGRFVLNRLPPGCESYEIGTNRLGGEQGYWMLVEKVVIAAGKTIDLGEIKLKRQP